VFPSKTYFSPFFFQWLMKYRVSFTWEKKNFSKFQLNENIKGILQTNPDNSDFWSNINFKMPVFMKTERRIRVAGRKPTRSMRRLKRRTTSKHNPLTRQSLGGQPRQLWDTDKVEECEVRIKGYQLKWKNILELTPCMRWTKHYWSPWHKSDEGRSIHFFTERTFSVRKSCGK